MDLREFLRIIRRSWTGIVAILALFLAVASLYTLTQKPTYSATTTAYVGVSTSGSVNDQVQGSDLIQQTVKTYAGIATSAYVLQPVIAQLDLRTSVGALQQAVTATAPIDTQLLTISADASTPSQAAAIANSVASNLAIEVSRINPTSQTTSAPVQVTQIDPATAPTTPSSPNTPLNLGVAAILGLLVGLGLAILRQRLDTRVRDAADVHSVIEAPVLGEVLDDPRADDRPIIAANGEDNRRAEAFRTLRTNLEFLEYDGGVRTMVVTSSLAQEGKSVSIANLAVVLSEAGRKVVLVDADLRRPRLASLFGLENALGLTDVLIGTMRLDTALQTWAAAPSLTILPAGRIPPNPSELLQSEAMEHLIDELSQRFDVVLFDAPPVVPVSDAAILSRRTSGALVIAAAGRTRRADLRRAAENLRQVDGNVLGVVLTMVPIRRSASYGYERLRQPGLADGTA